MEHAQTEPLIVVYRAVNAVNGHTYIGFTTKGLHHREAQHRWHRSNASLFQRAIAKHGQEAFTFTALGDFGDDEELAKIYEREAIEKYQPEYNLNYGGDGGSTHPATRQKISAANKGNAPPFKGRKWSAEALAKFRATKARNGKPPGNTGKKASPEKLAKMRAAALGKPSPNKGRVYSSEVRARMAEAARSRKPRVFTDEQKARSAAQLREAVRKPVRCLEDGREFSSATAAAKFYGVRPGSVSRVASGSRHQTAGLRFVYIEKPQ